MPVIRRWKSGLAEEASNSNWDVVSSEDETLILVDETDRIVGHLAKGACHDGDGVLHRAFSIFVFSPSGELLLQRRSATKRLWPRFWSNTCCSHPRQGETVGEAVERRLQQELGMTSDLSFLYKFQYQARYRDLGSENELCWVFIGLSGDDPSPNPHEIEELRWITPTKLDDEMASKPEAFTPWFKMEWIRVRDLYRQTLGL